MHLGGFSQSSPGLTTFLSRKKSIEKSNLFHTAKKKQEVLRYNASADLYDLDCKLQVPRKSIRPHGCSEWICHSPWQKGRLVWVLVEESLPPKLQQFGLVNLRRVYYFPTKFQSARHLFEHMYNISHNPQDVHCQSPFLWEGKMTILALEMEAHQSESTRGQDINFEAKLHPSNFRVEIQMKKRSGSLGVKPAIVFINVHGQNHLIFRFFDQMRWK